MSIMYSTGTPMVGYISEVFQLWGKYVKVLWGKHRWEKKMQKYVSGVWAGADQFQNGNLQKC